MEICKGLITRKREVKHSLGIKTEEAVLDFFVINERRFPYIKRMLIDEEREFTLSNFSQLKQNMRVIESDHNPLILDLSIDFSRRKPARIEMFNLKNKYCQETFKQETDTNSDLIEVFNTKLPFDIQCNQWFKTFNSILHKCFKKVRIVSNKKKVTNETDDLIVERIDLKKKVKNQPLEKDVKEKLEERIKQIEKDIEEKGSNEYIKEIVDSLKALGGGKKSLGGDGRKQMWSLLKNKCPKSEPSVPVGKKDKSGNLITNHKGLKQLYLQTYIHRLRNRPIKEDLRN